MCQPIITKTRLALLLAVATLLSACATTPVAHDDADRLFLAYLKIAQRSSPATIEDALDLAPQAKQLSASNDPCILAKGHEILNPYLMATLTIGKNDTNWPQASAEGRQLLKKVQKTPLPSGCAGREFPQVQID